MDINAYNHTHTHNNNKKVLTHTLINVYTHMHAHTCTLEAVVSPSEVVSVASTAEPVARYEHSTGESRRLAITAR